MQDFAALEDKFAQRGLVIVAFPWSAILLLSACHLCTVVAWSVHRPCLVKQSVWVTCVLV